MDEFDALDMYNGDTVHDMYVDSDYEINTGELPDILDEATSTILLTTLTIGIDV